MASVAAGVIACADLAVPAPESQPATKATVSSSSVMTGRLLALIAVTAAGEWVADEPIIVRPSTLVARVQVTDD
jgi:hypothetical protein